MLCIGYEKLSDQCVTSRNEAAITEIRCKIEFSLSRRYLRKNNLCVKGEKTKEAK